MHANDGRHAAFGTASPLSVGSDDNPLVIDLGDSPGNTPIAGDEEDEDVDVEAVDWHRNPGPVIENVQSGHSETAGIDGADETPGSDVTNASFCLGVESVFDENPAVANRGEDGGTSDRASANLNLGCEENSAQFSVNDYDVNDAFPTDQFVFDNDNNCGTTYTTLDVTNAYAVGPIPAAVTNDVRRNNSHTDKRGSPSTKKPRLDSGADREFWTEFLLKYRKYQCLWNRNYVYFTDENQKRIAYDDLVQLCRSRFPGADKEYVVRRLHGFRKTFLRELKNLRTLPPADGRSNLWYFELLSFLMEVEPFRSCGTTADQELDPLQHEEVASGAGESAPNGATPNLTHSRTKRRRKDEEMQTARNPCEDEHDVLGRFVAMRLRALSVMAPAQAIFAQRLITHILFLGRLGALHRAVRVEPPLPAYAPPAAAAYRPPPPAYAPPPPRGHSMPVRGALPLASVYAPSAGYTTQAPSSGPIPPPQHPGYAPGSGPAPLPQHPGYATPAPPSGAVPSPQHPGYAPGSRPAPLPQCAGYGTSTPHSGPVSSPQHLGYVPGSGPAPLPQHPGYATSAPPSGPVPSPQHPGYVPGSGPAPLPQRPGYATSAPPSGPVPSPQHPGYVPGSGPASIPQRPGFATPTPPSGPVPSSQHPGYVPGLVSASIPQHSGYATPASPSEQTSPLQHLAANNPTPIPHQQPRSYFPHPYSGIQ